MVSEAPPQSISRPLSYQSYDIISEMEQNLLRKEDAHEANSVAS